MLALGIWSGHHLSVSQPLAWAGTCYRNCTARHRKLQHTPSLARLLLACWAIPWKENGQSGGIYWPYFREGVGIFLAPLEEILLGLPPKARSTCFLSAFVSGFLLVSAVFTTVLLKQFSWEKDCSPLGWGCRCSEGSLQLFPSVNFAAGGRQNVPCISQVPSGALPS